MRTSVQGAVDGQGVLPKAQHAELRRLQACQTQLLTFSLLEKHHMRLNNTVSPLLPIEGNRLGCTWTSGAAMALIWSMVMNGCRTENSGGVKTWNAPKHSHAPPSVTAAGHRICGAAWVPWRARQLRGCMGTLYKLLASWYSR